MRKRGKYLTRNIEGSSQINLRYFKEPLFTLIILSISILFLFPTTYALADTDSETLNTMVYIGMTIDVNEYLNLIGEESLYSVVQTNDIVGAIYISYYLSADTKIATVDDRGIIKGIAEGNTQITVAFTRLQWSSEINDYYVVATFENTINVYVIPYDASTGQGYFKCDIENGGVTITGLYKQKADIVIPEQIAGFPVKKIADFAFSEDTKLKSVKLLGNVESLGDNAFFCCSNLVSVSLCNTVKVIGSSTFLGCWELATINFPESLVSLGADSFAGCGALKDITLDKNLESIGENSFRYCYSLNSIMLPDKIKSIEPMVFSNCSSLKSVVFGKNITSIKYAAFLNCIALKKIELPSCIEEIGQGAFGCTSLTSVKVPEGVKQIGIAAFSSCKALKSVKLPESLETIEKNAFTKCTSINKLTIPDGVKSIGDGAFSFCTSLTEVIVNNDIVREVGSDIFKNSPYESIEKAYVNHITFHFSKADWKEIKYLQNILSKMKIKEDDPDVEKIRKVHDWLVINTTYSKKKYMYYLDKVGLMKTVLEKHFAMCDSYAKVFKMFMDLQGIECIYVDSKSMIHSWNMVKLDDGCWYHIDVTWDDPGSNDKAWEKGCLSYSNLLRDDTGIISTGHSDWDPKAPKADGTKYLNFFDINYFKRF